MYRSTNMLRTRRRDNNVKPNRRETRFTRLDRKSSRGMIYENEELRLKTININAEIERGQSDIKKLKRENEMLKKEIWCLRDEYEKLDKLLKDKEIELSSSSTTCSSSSSDSESCSSCSEEFHEVEASQNRENVQKTCGVKKLCDGVDQLSVVPEETTTTTENSSNRASSVSPNQEVMVLKADQSYPVYGTIHKASTLPIQSVPGNFFSPIKPSRSFEDGHFEQHELPLYPEELYDGSFAKENLQAPLPNGFHTYDQPNLEILQQDDLNSTEYYTTQKTVDTAATKFYQNMILVPKQQQGNLQGMDKASTDLIVKLDNRNFESTPTRSTFSNGGNLEDLLNDIETISRDILQMSAAQNTSGPFQQVNTNGAQNLLPQIEEHDEHSYLHNPEHSAIDNQQQTQDSTTSSTQKRPYKSELNVTLMPTPMPLIGTDKYKSIQRSLESLHSRSLDNLNAPNVVHFEDKSPSRSNLVAKEEEKMQQGYSTPLMQHRNVPQVMTPVPSTAPPQNENPFYFGKLNDEFFSARYNPDNYLRIDRIDKIEGSPSPNKAITRPSSRSPRPDQQATNTENVEDLNFKTTKPENTTKETQSSSPNKTKGLSIRRKVSIHFKGRSKDKTTKKSASHDNANEKKHPLFDVKFSSSSEGGGKSGKVNSSAESSAAEPKTPSGSEGATNKIRQRKSASVSPERTQQHHQTSKTEKKCHKKHKKGPRTARRNTAFSMERVPLHRERSFSICTDRSNMIGAGLGQYYDSDRDESLSSCDTTKTRKMSSISNIPLTGKVPWCGCWGNGCL